MAEDTFGYWAIKISAAIFFIFLLTLAFPGIITDYRLVSSEILMQPWTLITHIFLHSVWLHLLYNLSGFIVFGSIAEKLIGTKRFLAVFFISGIAAGIGGSFFYASMIGASGAIFGVLGALAVIRPRQLVLALDIPISVIGAVIIYALIDIALIFSPDNIAHASHLFGIAAGAIMGLELRARYPKLREDRNKGESRQENPTDEELDEWEKKYMVSGITSLSGSRTPLSGKPFCHT